CGKGRRNIGGERGHRRLALARVALEAPHHSRLERGREVQARHGLIQRHRVLCEQLLEQLAWRATAMRVLPSEHPVRDRGEAVDVGPTVHQLPGQGLGGDILEGADEESGAREALFRRQLRIAGDAEVEQLGPLRLRVVGDVLGFQVAVDDARAVYVFGEGLALGLFESEVVQAVRFAVVVGADDSRVHYPRAVPCLPKEALYRRGVAREPRPQYLERTRAALRVLGAVHFGRASLADALEEAVAGDGPTGEVLVGHGNARN